MYLVCATRGRAPCPERIHAHVHVRIARLLAVRLPILLLFSHRSVIAKVLEFNEQEKLEAGVVSGV